MKKLLILMLCMIFLMGSVAAADWDNKVFYSDNDLKVTLRNSILGIIPTGEIGTAELKSHPSVDYIREVNLGDQVVMWYDFNFYIDYENGLGIPEFTDMETGERTERDWKYVYWKEDIDTFIDKNGTEQIIDNSRWLPYNSKDIPTGEIRIGIEVNVLPNDYIDGIWIISGKRISRHAVWTSSNEEAWTYATGTFDTITDGVIKWINCTATEYGIITNIRAMSGTGGDNGKITITIFQDGEVLASHTGNFPGTYYYDARFDLSDYDNDNRVISPNLDSGNFQIRVNRSVAYNMRIANGGLSHSGSLFTATSQRTFRGDEAEQTGNITYQKFTCSAGIPTIDGKCIEGLNISLLFPPNQSDYEINYLNFSINTSVTGISITNITLEVWDSGGIVYNDTNSSGYEGVYSWQNISFIDGDYYWTAYGYGNNSLRYNATEGIYIFSVQTIGTEVNYTTPIIETNNHTIYFNLNSTNTINSVSASVDYNGTIYSMDLLANNATDASFSLELTAPAVDKNTPYTFWVNYIVNGYNFNTSNYTQTIYDIPSLNITTANCSDMALNFTLKDEGNLTALTGTFQYNFIYGTSDNSTIERVYGEISSASGFNVCINSSVAPNWTLGEGQIFYTADTYVDRRYYLFSGMVLTNKTNNITLYSLKSSEQTSFKLEIEDSSLNPYVDKYATLIRWYPDLNKYNVVDMGLTDETGSTLIHVKPEDVDYRIGVYEKNGTIIKLANPIRMVCLVTPCTYTLKITPEEIDYTSFLGVQHNLDYNKNTGIWTFTFLDSSQTTTEMNLTIYRLTGTSVYPICTSSLTAYAGAITCNTSAYTGTLRGVVTRKASPKIPIAEKIVTIAARAFSSSFGLWISVLIAIPIIFIFAFMTPLGAIVGGIVALIPAFYFGSIGLEIIGAIAVLGGIVMHFLKRV